MAQKHSMNTFLAAAVLAGMFFIIALTAFLTVADYTWISSLFLASLIALLAGIVLFLGFGASTNQPATMVARAAAPVQADTAEAPVPSAAPPSPAPIPDPEPVEEPSAPSAEETAAAEKAAAFQEEAARMKAAEEAAAEAAAASAKRRAEEEARVKAEDEAARKSAEEEAAEAARVKTEEEATEAAASAAPSTAANDHGIPDYDGDGKLEGTDEGTRPAGLDAPRDGQGDNLKEIKGIGPKLEKLCNRLGFWHFDQIAAWSSNEVAWVDANLEGFKGRVTRDRWVEQAGILASGGETEFSKRVEDGDVY
ncbi:MAG: hypothetical protein AAF718_05725 [Pseudomonadota bacterium]